MEQTMIYDFLGIDQDPLLQKLRAMDKGQQITVGEMKVRLNKVGLFELITETTEECCSNITKCYYKIQDYLDGFVLE
ncbi:hypothetical protein ACDI16_02095 [Oceanobacillus caeni]